MQGFFFIGTALKFNQYVESLLVNLSWAVKFHQIFYFIEKFYILFRIHWKTFKNSVFRNTSQKQDSGVERERERAPLYQPYS